MSSHPADFFDTLKLAGIISVFGMGALYSGLRRMRQTRRVQDMGAVPVASAPQGLVELQGYAWPIDPLTSPVERKAVVYYSLLVEEEVGSGKNRRWKTIFRDESSGPFFLADESGHALVYPEGAELEIRRKTHTWKSLALDQKQRLVMGIRKTLPQFSDSGLLFSKNIRVQETIIPAGSPLYALGGFQTTHAAKRFRPAVGLKIFLHKVRVLKRNPLRAQTILDTDRDGRVSFEEWYAGSAQQAVAAGGGFRDAPMILPRGMHHDSQCHGALSKHLTHALLLADCHQDELVGRLGSWNKARVVAGAALLALAVVLVVAHVTGSPLF